jgi:hypothetical protein
MAEDQFVERIKVSTDKGGHELFIGTFLHILSRQPVVPFNRCSCNQLLSS